MHQGSNCTRVILYNVVPSTSSSRSSYFQTSGNSSYGHYASNESESDALMQLYKYHASWAVHSGMDDYRFGFLYQQEY